MKRKEFIYKAGRWGLFVLLALVIGLFIKRKQLSPDPATCSADFCKNCSKLKKCDLPEAKMARNDGKER